MWSYREGRRYFSAPSDGQTGRILDRDIRAVLWKALETPDPDTLVLNEFPITMGYSRLDVAVLNGHLEGFEIKSDRDTLERLDRQLTQYEQVCDQLTIVTTDRYVSQLEKTLPAWCGLMVAQVSDGWIHLEAIREPLRSPNWDILAMLLLLWQSETVDFARSLGYKAPRDLPKGLIHSQLAKRISHDDLRAGVLARLRSRKSRTSG